MYDNLRQAVGGVYKVVGWYAFGEAVALTNTIYEACSCYDENPEEKDNRKALKTVANQAEDFLRRMASQDQEFLHLKQVLHQIYMEK